MISALSYKWDSSYLYTASQQLNPSPGVPSTHKPKPHGLLGAPKHRPKSLSPTTHASKNAYDRSFGQISARHHPCRPAGARERYQRHVNTTLIRPQDLHNAWQLQPVRTLVPYFPSPGAAITAVMRRL